MKEYTLDVLNSTLCASSRYLILFLEYYQIMGFGFGHHRRLWGLLLFIANSNIIFFKSNANITPFAIVLRRSWESGKFDITAELKVAAALI